ncbi:hypothetical protein JCM15519_03130 [Fundidesulfovibrio butyratiphilus]
MVLPFGKSLIISVRGIRARLGRCLVTMVALVLAVAFLAFTLAGDDVARGLLASGRHDLAAALIRAGYDLTPGPEPGTFLPVIGAKQRWIVGLSLLVCAVGIVNAQLMSVTERFREIGAMKCLGALDSFVLRLFLLEALIQGLAGALAGALIGVAAAFAVGLARFGWAGVGQADWTGLATSFGLSLAAGVGLSLIGVVYPALVASRMPPVVAMRAEE